MKTSNSGIEIKAYSYKELAALYEVREKIFKRWLVPFKILIGAKIGRYYTPKQVKIIFKKLGTPHSMIIE